MAEAGWPPHRMDRSIELNSAFWDERAAAHAASPDYAVDRFVDDPTFLSDVVRFDLPRLGDMHGLDGVHLQCHIGTDTVSLARLGARMTGLDFSAPALAEARRLAAAAGVEATFVQSERLRRRRRARRGGASTWSSPVSARSAGCPTSAAGPAWSRGAAATGRPAATSARATRCCGRWTTSATTACSSSSTPTSRCRSRASGTRRGRHLRRRPTRSFTTNVTHEWNHGLGEIVTALLDAGMELTMLEEHDSVPWEALPGHMERDRRRRMAAHRPAPSGCRTPTRCRPAAAADAARGMIAVMPTSHVLPLQRDTLARPFLTGPRAGRHRRAGRLGQLPGARRRLALGADGPWLDGRDPVLDDGHALWGRSRCAARRSVERSRCASTRCGRGTGA